jgi:hypothetical protein
MVDGKVFYLARSSRKWQATLTIVGSAAGSLSHKVDCATVFV